jgi:hypothetical protein
MRENARPPIDCWYAAPMKAPRVKQFGAAEGWEMGKNLALQNGRLVVARLTIQPKGDTIPEGGITARLLRHVKISGNYGIKVVGVGRLPRRPPLARTRRVGRSLLRSTRAGLRGRVGSGQSAEADRSPGSSQKCSARDDSIPESARSSERLPDGNGAGHSRQSAHAEGAGVLKATQQPSG